LHYADEVDARRPVGQNPPPGAIIDYYLKSAPKGEVTLDILDAQGKLVRHLSSKEKKGTQQPPEWPDLIQRSETIPAHAGMNRLAWDLRYNQPVQVPGAFYSGTGPRGPLALPGDYQVKLTADGKSETAPLHLNIDPRTKDSGPAIQKQFALAMQVNDCISRLHGTINEIRQMENEIKHLHDRFGDDPKMKDAFAAADDLNHRMRQIEEQLIQVNMKGSEANLAFPSMLNERFDAFSHFIEGGDNAPTQSQLNVFQTLNGKLDEQLKKWADLKSADVPKVNDLIKEANLPALYITEKTGQP
jgi:hypothetical protein